MTFVPRSLPSNVQELCNRLKAPPRLVAHLTLVHDVAVEIVDSIQNHFPNLNFDTEAVLFGAATHDLGKILHPHELTGPGTLHENAGATLLEQQGVTPELSRFAKTHGKFSEGDLPIEDLLVSLADHIWKGKRQEELESRIVAKIAERTGSEAWGVFDCLDQLLVKIAADSEERLAWQQRF